MQDVERTGHDGGESQGERCVDHAKNANNAGRAPVTHILTTGKDDGLGPLGARRQACSTQAATTQSNQEDAQDEARTGYAADLSQDEWCVGYSNKASDAG